jgi:hypothetical protein
MQKCRWMVLVVAICSMFILVAITGTITVPVKAATATPSADCNADNVLANLKELVPYDEFTMHYSTSKDSTSLVVWFVDPDLDVKADAKSIEKYVTLAQEHAASLVHLLNSSDRCVAKLFAEINPIVVDSNYNGWLSAQIDLTKIPAVKTLSKEDIDDLIKLFDIGFTRKNVSKIAALAPKDSCTWQDANKNLHSHFSPERQNVSFQFTIDDNGVNVWAQWDSPTDLNFVVAALTNVVQEIRCLHPKVDQLFVIVVDKDGVVFLIGAMSQKAIQAQDIGQMQILYRKE